MMDWQTATATAIVALALVVAAFRLVRFLTGRGGASTCPGCPAGGCPHVAKKDK